VPDSSREVRITSESGMTVTSSLDTMPTADGVLRLGVPAVAEGRILVIQLVNAPGRWHRSEQSLPMRLMVHGSPPFLAVNPGQWFLPTASRPVAAPKPGA